MILGNPPYNDQQSNWYDANPNRKYPEIDKRISETYVKESRAQRTHQYDMYKRFIRWASDRLADDGIIAFVSNSAFLDSRQDDGFRKVVAEEFNELWVIGLKGNARTSGERRRREGGNVFDDKIRVGVAIYFLVRRMGADGFRVFHTEVSDYARAIEKIDFVANKHLDDFEFSTMEPDSYHDWLNQSHGGFSNLVPLANRRTKLAKTKEDEEAIFALYSVGISTNRDEWVYDFEEEALSTKVLFFCRTYRNDLQRLQLENPSANSIGAWVNKSIKWTSELEQHFGQRR